MPIGRYRVFDGQGTAVGTEEFRAGPGPAGWRYVASITTTVPEPHGELVDLVVDRSWRPVRVRIDTGAHHLMASPRADRLAGVLDGEPLDVGFGPEVEIDYLSPSFNAVTARRLARTAEIDVVYLEPYTCRPQFVRQRYELQGEEIVDTPVGRFQAERWQYTSLDSGWTNPLWLAEDVVVRFQALFELDEYEPGGSGAIPIG
ncbi:MAG TPA: hypothetical protein VHH92_00315 [Actinomycetota bacterium]|nr:hypothetical protein [Actinomycetota bacterium]